MCYLLLSNLCICKLTDGIRCPLNFHYIGYFFKPLEILIFLLFKKKFQIFQFIYFFAGFYKQIIRTVDVLFLRNQHTFLFIYFVCVCYVLLSNLCICKLTDGLVLSHASKATLGSGENPEDDGFLADDQPPGDIVFGMCRSVPPAR